MQRILKENFSTFGRTTLRKFGKLKIYIQGLSKIGAELTSNLVILSPHLITLYDNELIRLEDCYNTFHYPKQFVGKKTRAEEMIEICHRLNNKVYVDKTNTELNEDVCLKYDIVIFCDIYDLGRVIMIDKYIRMKKSKTVVMFACQMGFFGLMVTDFGEEWEMLHSGQELPRINIYSISNAHKGEVTTTTPHGYETGDFVTINYVEGMKYVNGDARPVTVINEDKFLIEDTRNFGVYLKGGVCEKVDLMQKLKFQSFEDQLSKWHSEIMLVAKAIICYYQNNSKLPSLFDQNNETETYQNIKILSQKSGQQFDEMRARSVIKTCEYSFYPLVHMFSAILSLECVKCTGKYKPVKSPFIVDWYDKISFEVKKKIDGQIPNIIDTGTLQKLGQLQVGIIDDGSISLELLNLLYSCSIADQTRVVLYGLESISESKQKSETDGLTLKAHLKFQVSNQLFKNKKTETIPCSLSFANHLILSDTWKKIKLLINSSSKFNEYVYNNIVWNQIDIVDSQISELNGILKIGAAGRSQLHQRDEVSLENSQLLDYRSCVETALQQFKLLFVEIFEDVRCFFLMGGSYFDQVRMEKTRRNIFLFIIICLEDGSHMDPENIVKICKYVFMQFFPTTQLDSKDHLVMDLMRSLYYLISWFFTQKQPKSEQINNQFILHLNKQFEQLQLSEKQKYDIAFSKLAMSNQLAIPYLSLSDLYRREHTIKFIWNGSQIHSKKLVVQQQVISKKFYKYYFRKLKPCPFISQILNSMIPIMALQSAYGKLHNIQIDMIEGKIKDVECPPPIPTEARENLTLVPNLCNEWTIITIEGPKKISQIIDRFTYMQNIDVKKIRCMNHSLYDAAAKKNLYIDIVVEKIPVIEKMKEVGKNSYELHIQAVDKEGRHCQVSRVKYVLE